MASSADRHQHLGALIAEQVQAQPQAVCLVEQGQSYSRADLWGSACRYAEHLRAQQITKSGTIALVVLDTRTGLEVLIAAWSLGAAVLFLDPRQSIEERYSSKDEYMNRVRAAAQELVDQRLLRAEDLETVVDNARSRYEFAMNLDAWSNAAD